MRYIAAYLLATLGGNDAPSEDNLKSILASVGIDYDADKANMVLNALKGKSIDEIIKEGEGKLASMPSAGAAPAAPAAAGGAAAAAAPAPVEEEKEESDDEDMGFGLFD